MNTSVDFRVDWEEPSTGMVYQFDVIASIAMTHDMYGTGDSPTGLEITNVEIIVQEPETGHYYTINFDDLSNECQVYIETQAIEELNNRHLQETYYA